KGTADEVPMTLNAGVRPHLKVRPAELAFHLLVALFDPQPQAIQADDFRQVGRGERGRGGAGGARPREIRQQIPGGDAASPLAAMAPAAPVAAGLRAGRVAGS